MNTTLMWVLIGIVGVGSIASLIVTVIRREKARGRALAAVAQELGFSLVNGDGNLHLDAFSIATNLFTQDASGKAYNALEGKAAGLRVILFDYRYVTGSGDSVSTVQQTVATFATPRNNLPKFVLKKKRLLSRLSSKKIEIDGNPEFSRRFALTGADAIATQTLFGPALAGFLASTKLEEKFLLEGGGQWLVLYREGQRLRPEQWRGFFEETSQIAIGFFQNCSGTETVKAG